ncbi:MAG: hypothetical protein LQ341_003090 [Variospora aurantia]|nr:MAG: hypothetical protein LQ341_003090 [Variospora aurantia]
MSLAQQVWDTHAGLGQGDAGANTIDGNGIFDSSGPEGTTADKRTVTLSRAFVLQSQIESPKSHHWPRIHVPCRSPAPIMCSSRPQKVGAKDIRALGYLLRQLVIFLRDPVRECASTHDLGAAQTGAAASFDPHGGPLGEALDYWYKRIGE